MNSVGAAGLILLNYICFSQQTKAEMTLLYSEKTAVIGSIIQSRSVGKMQQQILAQKSISSVIDVSMKQTK